MTFPMEPLDEAARVTVGAVRAELGQSPLIDHVTFAMRGSAAYQAFEAALAGGDEAVTGAQGAAGGQGTDGTRADGALRA